MWVLAQRELVLSARKSERKQRIAIGPEETMKGHRPLRDSGCKAMDVDLEDVLLRILGDENKRVGIREVLNDRGGKQLKSS